jgi:hypothetical protein
VIRRHEVIERLAGRILASPEMNVVRRNEVVEVPTLQVLAPVTVPMIRGNFLQIGSAINIGALHRVPPFG